MIKFIVNKSISVCYSSMYSFYLNFCLEIFFFYDFTGFWLMHCHIQLHSTIGMAMMFNEAPSQHSRVPHSFPVCGDFPSNESKHPLSVSLHCYMHQDPHVFHGSQYAFKGFYTLLCTTAHPSDGISRESCVLSCTKPHMFTSDLNGCYVLLCAS